MDNRETALYIFRRLVYVLYLEIGALQPANHAQIAQKARLNTAFFQRDKERQSLEMFYQVEEETETARILAPLHAQGPILKSNGPRACPPAFPLPSSNDGPISARPNSSCVPPMRK